MLEIKQLTEVNDEALKDMNALVLQLSSRGYQMTKEHFELVVGNKNNYMLALYDGSKIVGTACLMMIPQITGRKSYMEDVVVDENYRGQQWGKKLVLELIEVAKKLHIDSIELKSEPHRVAANALYKSLGFVPQEANVYKMKF